MFLPAAILASIHALYRAHLILAIGTEDQRRQLARKIAEQAVFDCPADGYGWKSSSPTNPPSKDSIARQVNGRLYSWDLFNGNTREPWPNPVGEDITGQHFIPVTGVNHLGGAAPVPPVTTPPVTPPPAVDLPSLEQWLHVEYPQLLAAFRTTHPGVDPPDDWQAFQTYRRLAESHVWTFDRMLAWELAQ